MNTEEINQKIAELARDISLIRHLLIGEDKDLNEQPDYESDVLKAQEPKENRVFIPKEIGFIILK